MSINSLFNIGQSALHAQQATIATTGNNIANVDTPGYSRQYVQLEDAYALNNKPGSQGMGVDAVQVLRRFDQFVEVSFLDKSSIAARWAQQEQTLSSVESIFNESNRTGINDALTSFFQAWDDLALWPDDEAVRQDLISRTQDLSLFLNQTMDDLETISQQMDLNIQVDVDRVNELSKEIANLNKQIMSNTIPGVSNPNDLLDKRDTAVRELATLVDVVTETTSEGEFVVRTASGHPLVQGTVTHDIEFMAAHSESDKLATSTYDGELTFVGDDSFEYTVEMLTGGSAGAAGDPNNPTYRVSLDGGKTWLKDINGKEQVFEVSGSDTDGDGVVDLVDPVQVHNLSISFTETENFTAGDKFNITPKSGLYWIEPTRGPQNITPQSYFDGNVNDNRLTGGSLTAHFAVRDDHIGRYEDELNAVAESLIWEVNSIHSRGASLDFTGTFYGSESVEDNNIPLGMPQSGLHYYDRLSAGTMQFHFYNAETGAHMQTEYYDFDPSTDSLSDVVATINADPNGPLQAEIVDGKLNIQTNPNANPKLDVVLGEDTTGLMTAMGINTYFKGTNAEDIAVHERIATNLTQINAGYVDGDGQLNAGDNANKVGGLMTEQVNVSTPWRTTGNQSIIESYSVLVSRVGSDSRTAQTNAEYNEALATDLSNQQQAVSGVNLDEEMANLIKFQHAYTAAAKLITTADQMLETLLSLKQ